MTSGGGWRARVVRPRDLPAGDGALWTDFCAADPSLAHPFFSLAFARAVDRVHPRTFVAVLERNGRVVGFLPFQFPGPVAAAARAGQRIGADMGDRFGVIAGAPLGIAPAELLGLAGLNSLSFAYMPPEQLRHGFPAQKPMPGQRVLLGNARALWSERGRGGRSFAGTLARKERVLTRELGPLTMTFAADAETELPRLIAAKRAHYKSAGLRDILAAAWKRDLLRDLLRHPDPDCTGVLSTLSAGGTWLASNLALMSPRVFHQWVPAYNAAWGRCSPGHILTKALMRAARDAGVGQFDFGGWVEYKEHFGTDVYECYSGFWRTDRPGGFVNQAAKALAGHMQGLVLRWGGNR